jgi:hypothetical protein
MDDDAYASLQDALAVNPELGDVIQGTNGLRKVRWAIPGRGKRGGMRVIYYWILPKGSDLHAARVCEERQDDLTPEQRRALVRLVKQELEDG